MLTAALTALFTAALCLYQKNVRVLLSGALTLVPNAVYTVLYLILLRMGE